MDKITEIIILAISVAIVAVAITYVFNLQSTGKDALNQGNEQIVEGIAAMTSGQWDMYDGSTQSGETVIRVINSTFSDVNIEVLVCTKDGANLVYNLSPTIYGVTSKGTGSMTINGKNYTTELFKLNTNVNDPDPLSNIPAEDANGSDFTVDNGAVIARAFTQDFVTNAGWASDPTKSEYTNIMTGSGYNVVAPMSNPGYIAPTAYFTSSVQKDINNQVRRITFVQK